MKNGNAKLNDLLYTIDHRFTIPDRVAAFLLAMCPLLQHYRGPVYNAALSVMVLLVPYFLIRMTPKLQSFRLSSLYLVSVLVLYMIYRVIDHGTSITEFGQSGVLIVYFIAVALGAIDVKFFCRVAVIVSLVASILLIVQYIGFYCFDHHIQLVPVSLLLPSADQWVLGAKTGLAGITGKKNDFYRPSAFFLEPSHVYIYMFPHLLISLFSGKGKKALLASAIISVGLILCTSGMGIAVVLGAWGLFLVLYNEKDHSYSVKNVIRLRNIIMLILLVIAFLLAVKYVRPVRRTVLRLFTTGTGATAITARISRALRGLEDLTPLQWIIGVEDTTHGISYNMPGLIAAIYRYGVIGMIMSLSLYARSIYDLKLPYALVGMIIVVTSFFSAHTHSTVGMLYFTLILMCGYLTQRRECGIFSKCRRSKRKDQLKEKEASETEETLGSVEL
ncbi:MAG: hypothetical protein IJW99_06980 [Clostridia bacterium]|nr:hypothetical protein [Clostridia bacterium]